MVNKNIYDLNNNYITNELKIETMKNVLNALWFIDVNGYDY